MGARVLTFRVWQQMLRFLHYHAPEVCVEVRHAYIETMGKMLLGLFKAYTSALMKVWCLWRAALPCECACVCACNVDLMLVCGAWGQQLKLNVATKNDLIVVEQNAVKVRECCVLQHLVLQPLDACPSLYAHAPCLPSCALLVATHPPGPLLLSCQPE